MNTFAPRTVAPALVLAVSLAPVSVGAATIPQSTAATSATQARAAAAPRTDSFNVASFNVVGHSHTSGRGGLRSGTARMKGAIAYLGKHQVTLAGLQELEPPQASAFLKQTRGRWGLVGAPSRSGRSTDTRNSVAYYKGRFALVKRTYVPITYFYGKRVNIPLVQLRSKRNGKVFWVLNTHNPADTHGPAGRWRAVSVRRQLQRIQRLRSQGQTVLFTGDMNAKRPFFCTATRSGVLHSASGGSVGTPCRYPRANGIDWVLGTRDVQFRNWRSDKTTRSRGISDHPIVVARATLR
jgi:hypothetical protein